jgi:hypothetical protein
MLKFEFSTEDLPEDLARDFNDFKLEIREGQDFNIHEIVSKFKSFLLGMTYSEDTVKKIKVED